MNIDLAKDMLEQLGYQVTEFLDSVAALKLFTERPLDFDLVITDYGMPKMNGKQFAESVNKIRPDMPIVLLTGYGDLIAKENINQWGINELLIKPFKLQELSEVVRAGVNKNPVQGRENL
jgi:CheY-like chemotaxis protein